MIQFLLGVLVGALLVTFLDFSASMLVKRLFRNVLPNSQKNKGWGYHARTWFARKVGRSLAVELLQLMNERILEVRNVRSVRQGNKTIDLQNTMNPNHQMENCRDVFKAEIRGIEHCKQFVAETFE